MSIEELVRHLMLHSKLTSTRKLLHFYNMKRPRSIFCQAKNSENKYFFNPIHSCILVTGEIQMNVMVKEKTIRL